MSPLVRRLFPPTLTALLLTAGALVPSTSAAAVPAAATASVTPAATTAANLGVQLADPDTVHGGNGHYFTYGTMVTTKTCTSATAVALHIPYTVSSTTTAPNGSCIKADALPGGAGSWAVKDSPTWAPGVVKFGKRWLLFYAARGKIAGHPKYNQMCLGVAMAGSAYGPFIHQRKVLCTANPRWSIDPDPVISGGRLYVVYRDDNAVKGNQTAISVFEATQYGTVKAGITRRTLTTSYAITWDTYARPSGTTAVVENPALVRTKGRWFLFYSANDWPSINYGVGIEDCGTSLFPLQKQPKKKKGKKPAPKPAQCRPLDTTRPYFGYSGSGDRPIATLPGDHPGPGGMDIFLETTSHPRVTWHWWNPANGKRYTMWGRLAYTNGTWKVT